MLNSVKIPKKLGLSFLLICASAAVVMIVFFLNISMIRASTAQNNESQAIHAEAQTLETALLRQNSQMRGFLVTADATYLKSYNDARDEYDKTSTELEAKLTEPAQIAAVRKSREATLDWRKKWGDRLIALVQSGQRDAAQGEARSAGKAVLVSDAVLPLRDIRDAQSALIAKNSARQDRAIHTATVVLVAGGCTLIGIAAMLAMMLSRMIARPITALTKAMADLVGGKNDINVGDTDRGDEVGDMARAVLVFRDDAIAKHALGVATAKAEAEQQMVVQAITEQLSELADGNLTAEIAGDFPGEYAAVKINFNAAVASLREVIASVVEGAASIRTGSGEIAQASEDLARRTEVNAASLEKTSAAVAEMDGRLKASATAATRTVSRADETITTVSDGRSTADEAVAAMTRVAESARGIDGVIEGLDKIAFQTRVLAMNAAVEAGRAGEAGRGFAVVADLVSALAMRAEEEAGRARDQLTATQTDIVMAVEAVRKVDGSLVNISTGVGEVHKLLAEMASDNQVQSTAVTEISVAIGSMDQSTQQNAAMVEETSAAARNLASEATVLSEQASRFDVGGAGQRPAARTSAIGFGGPTKWLPAAAVRALVRPSGPPTDDWQAF